MALMRRGAFTLIEVIVYLGLLLVVGTLVLQVFRMTGKTQRTTASAYAVTGQTDTAMDWLRRDLHNTALASVRSYPGSTALLTPGLTLASARVKAGSDQSGKMLISEYGAPAWNCNVFYGLEKKEGEQTGNLLRWEIPLTLAEQDRIPKIATFPTALKEVVAPRVVLRNVLCPNRKIIGLYGLADGWQASEWGGFRVQFVRRQGGESGQESVSSVNPSMNPEGGADNTRLVEVELGVCEMSMGAPNFYSLKFRVHPRY